MRIYAITIRPSSPFGTPLKGDTIFGHFCWQAVESDDILIGGIDRWIGCYDERPFSVFSSAWPRIGAGEETFAIRRPDLPLSMLEDPYLASDCEARLKNRKQEKARKWLLVGENFQVRLQRENMLNDQDLYDRLTADLPAVEKKRLRQAPDRHKRPVSSAEQQHNTINRLTMTTGKGEFAPYSMDNSHYLPGLELVVLAALDEEACGPDGLRKAFSRIGEWGFGRDASTGLGRFAVIRVEEIEIPAYGKDSDACLAIGPCVPEQNFWREMYFTPFIRFGRHGARMLHTGRPFKNPVVMADEGGVFVPPAGKFPKKPYIGRAVRHISKAQAEAVCQGYSLYLPMRLPDLKEGGEHV
ncbi:MAG: hypothetical protein RBR09_13575 [Desulfobulbaceae bacterium]|jgi:CRISPR-associated protein Csm4|nr:hypothetical protein [Deltaproteobacteria bacterium]MDY0352279.1 hypothetical protein [Desulfobulbaceae bacterium]